MTSTSTSSGTSTGTSARTCNSTSSGVLVLGRHYSYHLVLLLGIKECTIQYEQHRRWSNEFETPGTTFDESVFKPVKVSRES